MSFITQADLLTTIFQEQLDAIVREDYTIPVFAIDAAEEEMKGYLSPKYNVNKIFADAGDDRDKLLVMLCRDIAIYHMITISNPGIDYESRKARYDRAIRWCEQVRAGKVNPPDLELDDDDAENNEILMSSNTKRTQHY